MTMYMNEFSETDGDIAAYGSGIALPVPPVDLR